MQRPTKERNFVTNGLQRLRRRRSKDGASGQMHEQATRRDDGVVDDPHRVEHTRQARINLNSHPSTFYKENMRRPVCKVEIVNSNTVQEPPGA